MLYRRFGRTELVMPVFSCGGMRYQYKWQDVPLGQIPSDNQQNLEATIRRAIDLGITHIETARGYGTSEMQLGEILPKLPREKLIVQTKVSPKANAQEFRKTFEQSLAYLKLDHVDLLGLHGINNDELLHQSLRPGGCLEVAQTLQAQGKVRFIGFSTHGPTSVIQTAIRSNQFDYVNLHWYYILQRNWPAIADAHDRDMGVFIISPSDKGGHLYNPSQKLVELCRPLSPMVFNDLFCLSHPQVHTLSLGAARPSDFDEHLKTLPLLAEADRHLQPILERLEAEAVRCFSDRFGSEVAGREWYRTWHVGLPRPEQTPGGLNLFVMLWLWNLAVAYDMVEFAKARYNLMGNASHWFPGAKAERIDRAALARCLVNSPHADRIPDLLSEAHAMLKADEVKRLSQQ